jgi:adenylosuccinate lyase
VEVEYFIRLAQLGLEQLKETNQLAKLYPKMRNWYIQFTEKDAERIKEIEKTTNHDIKVCNITFFQNI